MIVRGWRRRCSIVCKAALHDSVDHSETALSHGGEGAAPGRDPERHRRAYQWAITRSPEDAMLRLRFGHVLLSLQPCRCGGGSLGLRSPGMVILCFAGRDAGSLKRPAASFVRRIQTGDTSAARHWPLGQRDQQNQNQTPEYTATESKTSGQRAEGRAFQKVILGSLLADQGPAIKGIALPPSRNKPRSNREKPQPNKEAGAVGSASHSLRRDDLRSIWPLVHSNLRGR